MRYRGFVRQEDRCRLFYVMGGGVTNAHNCSIPKKR